MAKLYDSLYDALLMFAASSAKPTAKLIEEKYDQLLPIFSSMYEGETVDKEKFLRKVLESVNTDGGIITSLSDQKEHEQWLSNERAAIQWNYWERYKQYLIKQEKFPLRVVDSIDDATDTILGLLESPRRKGEWDRRGMVVGNIQSGKTSNYVGLISKAVDAGYKVIIVLAGLNNDLRSQTQKRIDKGFLGRDTSKSKNHDQGSNVIGAGLIPGFKVPPVTAVTSSASNGDYKKSVHSSITITPSGDPVIAVVKKNVTPLKNLLDWFTHVNASGKIANIPLLLIDDEADNASIDTKAGKKMGIDESDWKEQDPTAINGYIRRILNCFTQSAYVGYTATPFANIFIYPNEGNELDDEFGEDLYPRSFIVNLHAPSNYIGPEKVFGLDEDKASNTEKTKPLPLIRTITDYDLFFPEKHKSSLKVKGIPDSMKEAICAFILSCAVRDARGQGTSHKSMLIHVTRFVEVQKQIVDILNPLMKNIVNELKMKTGPQYEQLIGVMKKLWNEDFLPTTKEVQKSIDDSGITTLGWDDIEPLLYPNASKIEVKAVNGKAADGGLKYDEYAKTGLSVIAVGGDKLSRGLTLEGLTVSYYTRTSKMYDTLLQMGRWFGFRNGYADVCRLYTSRVLAKWYRHIALVNKEFRQELDDMAAAGATPETYGLKVRTHPDGMIITALNKMRNSETRKVTFAGHLIQTTKFYKDNPLNKENISGLSNWTSSLGNPVPHDGNTPEPFIWKHVAADKIFNFLNVIKVHPENTFASAHLLSQYIEAQNREGELTDWTVALISVDNSRSPKEAQHPITIGNLTVRPVWRTDASAKEFDDSDVVVMNNNNLITPKHQAIDLDENQYNKALKETLEEYNELHPKAKKESIDEPSGRFVRMNRNKKNALLLIYVLKSGIDGKEEGQVPTVYDDTYVGYAISFPASPTAKEVEYKVDEVYMENSVKDEGNDDGTY